MRKWAKMGRKWASHLKKICDNLLYLLLMYSPFLQFRFSCAKFVISSCLVLAGGGAKEVFSKPNCPASELDPLQSCWLRYAG